MDVPLEIAFHNMDHSDALESLVREKAARLDRMSDRLNSCRVVVEAPHKHHRKGNEYHVRIFMGVPTGELVISRDPGDNNVHEHPQVAIRDAFDRAERKLKEYQRQLRGDVKAHETPLQGRVIRLFPDHGFIATNDGREIYFHRNAVVEMDFDEMETEQTVELVVARGDSENGPHASTVKPIGRMDYEPSR
jgi:ribosome-associated translation inhibitor RaiA/cold shock CspA family protein